MTNNKTESSSAEQEEESFITDQRQDKTMQNENCHEKDTERERPKVRVSDLVKVIREHRENQVVWVRSYTGDSRSKSRSSLDHSKPNTTNTDEK
jgi:hypothetical protein